VAGASVGERILCRCLLIKGLGSGFLRGKRISSVFLSRPWWRGRKVLEWMVRQLLLPGRPGRRGGCGAAHRLRVLRQIAGAVHVVAGWPPCLLSVAMEAALEAGFDSLQRWVHYGASRQRLLAALSVIASASTAVGLLLRRCFSPCAGNPLCSSPSGASPAALQKSTSLCHVRRRV
jgi:hypothetical protein